MVVHHVDVHPVGAADPAHLAGQVGEVGVEDARSDLDAHDEDPRASRSGASTRHACRWAGWGTEAPQPTGTPSREASMPRTSHRPLAALLGLTLAAGVTVTTGPTTAAGPAAGVPQPPKTPTSVGYGGAVSSVDPYASQVGLDVLKRGGNAADAAVAMAAALGVTEPYSAGHRRRRLLRLLRRRRPARCRPSTAARPRRRRCRTTRSSTPRPASPTASRPSWSPAASRSARPGTLGHLGDARWTAGARCRWEGAAARDRPGPPAASSSTTPSASRRWTTRTRFNAFTSTRKLYLPGGDAPAVGSRFRNPDLADTYAADRAAGHQAAFYRGRWPREIAAHGAEPAEDRGHRRCRCRPGYHDRRRPGALPASSTRRRRRSATAATTSTAWRRPPAAAPPSARR